MNLYVDIHVLQTVPPSCVNRDDTGSPKTALYGGTRRARVSSQAWKNVIRKEFRTLFSEELLGYRTKHITDTLIVALKKLIPDSAENDVQKKAKQALKNAGIKLSTKKEGEVDALFFFSNAQAEQLAKLIVDGEDDKKLYKQAMKDYPSVDMALFGRMVASDPALNYDAAAQVAHAISTHAVQNEYDYFTAIDDCVSEDNAGAGHLGTVEYNSSTLYRYATLNVCELFQALGNITPDVVKKFLDAFIRTMPTGKQNTFANRTMPDMIYVTIRKDQPINLSGAFEKAVVSREKGYVESSKNALKEYSERLYKDYDMAPEYEFVVGTDLWNDEETYSLSGMLDAVENVVKNRLK